MGFWESGACGVSFGAIMAWLDCLRIRIAEIGGNPLLPRHPRAGPADREWHWLRQKGRSGPRIRATSGPRDDPGDDERGVSRPQNCRLEHLKVVPWLYGLGRDEPGDDEEAGASTDLLGAVYRFTHLSRNART